MATQQSTCVNCSITGLPVFPALYAVAPAGIKPSLPQGISGSGVGDVALDRAQYGYGLRVVRAGYLYVFYEKGARGANYWECYTVHGDGCMTLQPSVQMSSPPQEKISCQRDGHRVGRTQYLVIPKPEQCGTVWLAFSEHHWTMATCDRYESDKKLRARRMQPIQPAEWITSAKAAGDNGHTAEATSANLAHLLEYRPMLNLRNAFGQTASGAISKGEDGAYDAARLLRQATRFPVSPRNDGAADGTTAMQVVEQMHVSGKRPDGKSHPPLLLGLWDAVGITHELNGFCGDVAGRLKQYIDERILQIEALKGLDGLRKALTGKARSDAEEKSRIIMSEGHFRDLMRVSPHPMGWPANVRHEPLTDPSDYGFDKVEVFPPGWEARRQKACDDAEFGAWTKYAAKLERETAGDVTTVRYKLDTFRENFGKVQEEAGKALDARMLQLIKWLEAEMFLDTLEDYDPKDPVDGVEFEDVIGDAVLGMNASPSGAKKLKQWADEGRVGIKANLLYRALAQNQTGHGTEIDELLKLAKANREVPYSAAAFAAALAHVKDAQKLADLYKKSNTLLNTNIKAKSPDGTKAFQRPLRAARTGGLDKVVMTAGDFVFKAFSVDKAADFVGQKIIQHLFSIRALVDPVDSKALIEADHGEWMRRKQEQHKRQGMTGKRAKAWRLDEMARREAEFRKNQPAAVTEAWKKFQAAKPGDGALAIKDIRLALVVGLIEGVNFSKLVCLYEGSARETWLLAASGMSVGAALFDIAAAPVKSVFGSDAISHQKLKLAGGVLSAGGAAIGAWYDMEDGKSADKKGQTTLSNLFYLKAALGGASAGTTALTTFTYAAPFIMRVTGNAALAGGAEALGARALAIIGTRIIFMSVGAWITAGIFAVQLIIWIVKDNALETWVSRTPFGKERQMPEAFHDLKKMEAAMSEAWAEVS